MREILFRGKHIHAIDSNSGLDGEWIYGYLCSDNYIYDIELGGEMLIIPETVGQYTGLTDKNGKKIFEGDILRANGYWDVLIEFDKGTFIVRDCDRVRYINKCTNVPLFNFVGLERYQIIGNIHDNPELLEHNS